jgi:hypothetical protein
MSHVLHHPGRYDVEVYVGHSEFVVEHNDVLVSVAPNPPGVRLDRMQSIMCGFTIGAFQHKGLHVPVANLRAYVLALHEVQEHVRRHLGCVPVGVRQLPAVTDMARAVLGWAGLGANVPRG